MTPLAEAHHISHYMTPQPLNQRGHVTTGDAELTREILTSSEIVLTRRIVSQIGSSQRASCDQSCSQVAARAYRRAHCDRTSTWLSRFGCIDQSTMSWNGSSSQLFLGAAA
jgi:hypothetical protein